MSNRAQDEADSFEAYLLNIRGIHRTCRELLDWQSIRQSPPPGEPKFENSTELRAKAALANYRPRLLDRIFRRSEAQKIELEARVLAASAEDREVYEERLQEFKSRLKYWRQLQAAAERIIAGDKGEIKSILIKELNSEDIEHLGKVVNIDVYSTRLVGVSIVPKGDKIIPYQEKKQLKSGALSVKPMSLSRRWTIYREHLLSASLRIAREAMAIVPIDAIIVDNIADTVDMASGRLLKNPILSLLFHRSTLSKIDFDTLNLEDLYKYCVIKEHFRKTTGFREVEAINHSQLRVDSSGN